MMPTMNKPLRLITRRDLFDEIEAGLKMLRAIAGSDSLAQQIIERCTVLLGNLRKGDTDE